MDLSEYTEKFKKIRREKINNEREIWAKNTGGARLDSNLCPEYFKVGELFNKRRAKLDKHILKNAKFKIGQSVKFTHTGERDRKTSCTGEISDIQTCQFGTGEIWYSFINTQPIYVYETHYCHERVIEDNPKRG